MRTMVLVAVAVAVGWQQHPTSTTICVCPKCILFPYYFRRRCSFSNFSFAKTDYFYYDTYRGVVRVRRTMMTTDASIFNSREKKRILFFLRFSISCLRFDIKLRRQMAFFVIVAVALLLIPNWKHKKKRSVGRHIRGICVCVDVDEMNLTDRKLKMKTLTIN